MSIKKITLLCVLATLPLNCAMAESFVDALLRFTGITVTSSKVRGPFFQGNLWLINIDESRANEAKQITSDGTYHSPLWMPGSDNILAIKESKLIQLNSDGSEEKIRRNLPPGFTILLGFDKSDSNSILILHGSSPAVLSLDSGQITLLPYDSEKKQDREALASLMSGIRWYGNTKVFIKNESIRNANGFIKETNKIHIKAGEQDLTITCPAECAQPALITDRNRLVFVGQ